MWKGKLANRDLQSEHEGTGQSSINSSLLFGMFLVKRGLRAGQLRRFVVFRSCGTQGEVYEGLLYGINVVSVY